MRAAFGAGGPKAGSLARMAGGSAMSDRDPFKDLGDRIERARRDRAPKLWRAPEGGRAPQHLIGLGLRVGLELVVALVVSVALGWAIDSWLGTRPWVTVALAVLGFAAGLVNVYRTLAGLGMAMGYRRDGATPPPRTDDWDDED